MKQDDNKAVIIFDFDETIIESDVDSEAFNMLPQNKRQLLSKEFKHINNWADCLQLVFKEMKNENITLDMVKECFTKLVLSTGFKELFEYLRLHQEKYDLIIMSGAHQFAIEQILEHNSIRDLFKEIISNPSSPDDDLLLKISPTHSHTCNRCDACQCKSKVFKDFIQRNEEIMKNRRFYFICDGENDFCLAKELGRNDNVCARKDYSFHKKVYSKEEYKRQLVCNVNLWESGSDIINYLEK